MSEEVRICPASSDSPELPITIEVDGDEEDLLEITITKERIYFDRFGDPKSNETQTMYYTFDDLLKKLKNNYE